MNQFINASNQSVLWKVVNNVALVQQYFANAPPGTKEKWFQTHIGQIYQSFYGKPEPLQSLNKKAIDIMLTSLREPNLREPNLRDPNLREPNLRDPNLRDPNLRDPNLREQNVREQNVREQNVRDPTYAGEPISLRDPQIIQLPGQAIKSATMDEFSRRQAEYDSMVNKQTPIANFSEPIKDEAITDLNTAVEQYKKMREPIELQVEEISEQKHVKWGTNQEHDHFETRILNAIANIQKDIIEIKAILNQSKDNPI